MSMCDVEIQTEPENNIEHPKVQQVHPIMGPSVIMSDTKWWCLGLLVTGPGGKKWNTHVANFRGTPL